MTFSSAGSDPNMLMGAMILDTRLVDGDVVEDYKRREWRMGG
jgi:hypothetical protein